MKQVVFGIVGLLAVSAMSVQADCGASCKGSNASATLSDGVGLVVSGTLELTSATGQFVVESVEKTTEGLILVIKASADVAKASATASAKVASTTIKLTGKAVHGLSMAAGEVVEVVAVSTGYTLYYSGKAIAFIPTEAGKALLEHAKMP